MVMLMAIDESQLLKHLSGYPEMLKFTKWLDNQFNELFSHLKITIIPKGVPYMLNCIMSWEIEHVEDEKLTIDLYMYPAGFRMRFQTDVLPFYDEILKQINAGVLKALDNSGSLILVDPDPQRKE